MELFKEDKEMYPRLLIANKDLALLVVWGFFAGFSERLLPSILTTTEARLAKTEAKTDRGADVRDQRSLD
jgi:hypothetical protein